MEAAHGPELVTVKGRVLETTRGFELNTMMGYAVEAAHGPELESVQGSELHGHPGLPSGSSCDMPPGLQHGFGEQAEGVC